MSVSLLPPTIQTLTDLEAAESYIDENIAARRSQQSSALDGVPTETQSWLNDLAGADTIAAWEIARRRVRDLMATVPVLDVISAQPLSLEERKQMVDWFRRELRADIVMRLAVRQEILGGVIIRTGRHQYDLSVAHDLNRGGTVLQEMIHGWS